MMRGAALLGPNLAFKEYYGLDFLFFDAQSLRTYIMSTISTRNTDA